LKNRNKILVTLLFLVKAISAQTYEFDLQYGFGASELTFNSVPGIAMSIYPIKNFGFSAGLQYSWHWKTKIGGINEANPATTDIYGDSLIFKYSMEEYKEKAVARILQVPLLLKYSNDSYYAGAGIKIGAVQKARVNVDYSDLETEGYYPKYDLTLTAPANQGFGSQGDSSFSTKISSKNLVMLTMEGGVKQKLNNYFAMLAGIFADYSFNKGFKRDLGPIVERVKNSNEATLAVNDRWKSWKPWSVGIAVKFAFMAGYPDTPEEPVKQSVPQSQPQPQPKIDSVQKKGNSYAPDLPEFLQNRKPDFVFHYPENRTAPTDSLHLVMIAQIADVMREKPNSKLHCVGYSEKLLSESLAYETAFQRALRIRFTLARFYSIEERRISIYSQGSNNDYRRAECFVIENP